MIAQNRRCSPVRDATQGGGLGSASFIIVPGAGGEARNVAERSPAATDRPRCRPARDLDTWRFDSMVSPLRSAYRQKFVRDCVSTTHCPRASPGKVADTKIAVVQLVWGAGSDSMLYASRTSCSKATPVSAKENDHSIQRRRGVVRAMEVAMRSLDIQPPDPRQHRARAVRAVERPPRRDHGDPHVDRLTVLMLSIVRCYGD